MEKTDRKRCLLIGNGFNRINDDHFPDWNALIKSPLDKYGLKDKFVDIENMSYPLKFEYIVNFINEEKKINSDELYQKIKQNVIDELSIHTKEKLIDKEVSDLLRKIHPDTIITTNYDPILEKVFSSKKSRYGFNDRTKKKMNNKKLQEEEKLLTKIATLDEIEFYHMHGIDVAPKTICLGYEHYTRIIDLLKRKISDKPNTKSNKLLSYLQSPNKSEIGKTYLARFFDNDIDIIALGLGEQEIDLWWILCYRAYLFFSDYKNAHDLIKNTICFYDVHPARRTADGYSYEEDYQKQKEALFKYMHIRHESVLVPNEKEGFKKAYIKALNQILSEKNNMTKKGL